MAGKTMISTMRIFRRTEMSRYLGSLRTICTAMLAILAMGMLLTGCATTIRSDVIAFHQWPTDMPGSTFTFTRTPEQEASLEYRDYEDMVRTELSRLGYIPEVDRRGSTLTVVWSRVLSRLGLAARRFAVL
jgi:hypothetical protein